MTEMDDLKGWYFPLTPKGIVYLVGDIPWHYGIEDLTILYRTKLGTIAEYLPAPLEPVSDPELGYVAFSKWWPPSESHPEMAYINPERTQCKEAAIWARCSYHREPRQICLHIWVDNDFSIACGWFMGFSKKLGVISKYEYQPLNPVIYPLDIDTKIKGFVATHGERLFEGSLMIQRHENPSEISSPIVLPVFLIRHFPGIVPDADPPVLELVKLGAQIVRLGEAVWLGDGYLRFFPSEIEKNMDLAPQEIFDGYHYFSGYKFPGGEVVHNCL
jgi:acetoacetate decarboxylase